MMASISTPVCDHAPRSPQIMILTASTSIHSHLEQSDA
jgi:hypothetical protein